MVQTRCTKRKQGIRIYCNLVSELIAMPAKARKSEQYSQPFCLEEDDVGRLWDILSTFDSSGDVLATVDCADNISRRFDSKDELLGYNNEEKKRIISLKLECHVRDVIWKAASIELSEKFFWNNANIRISIEGESDEVINSLTNQFMGILKNSSPWYRLLVKRTWTIQIIVSVVGIFLLKFVNRLIYESPLGQTNLGWSETTTTVYQICWLLLLVVWAVVIGGLAASRWRRIFPIGKIVIGLERKRENTREWIRRLVVSLALTALIAVAIKLIAN